MIVRNNLPEYLVGIFHYNTAPYCNAIARIWLDNHSIPLEYESKLLLGAIDGYNAW